MTVDISSQGRVYLRCPVVNAISNPTSDVVEFTFCVASAKPDGSSSWHTGSWDSSVTTSPYIAQVLVGISPGNALAAGDYDAYVRITDTTEKPVIGPYSFTVY